MKKQKLLKTLLVAVGLCMGVSAWAETTTAYSWTFTGLAADANVTNNGDKITEAGTECSLATAPSNCEGLYFQDTWKCYNTTTGLRNVSKGDRMLLIPNLKKGDVITVNCSNTDYINSAKYTGTANAEKTSIEYVMAEAGNFYFKIIKAGGSVDGVQVYPSITSIVVTREVIAGKCEDPSYVISGAHNNARTFTLSCETAGASIYYSTTELASATGGTLYSEPVETEATTIWAYAKTSSASSDVISFSTGAGTTLSLATPTISASEFTNTDGTTVNNPTFNFACNNGGIIGNPVATLSYTFTPAGGVETAAAEGTSYAPKTYGTLKVIASATGYNSSEKTLIVSNRYLPYFTGRDYSTATTSDISATWGDPYSVTWTDWASGLTATLASTAISDDQHLRIQNAGTISLVSDWGLVRGDQKTYGYGIRYVKEGEFVAFKENTSKGADASATDYQTVYCGYGTGVIGDLVTITVPAGYALQQLYHYTPVPASVSVEVTSAGMATYVNNDFDLDFSATGIEAYKVKVSTKGVATLTKVDNVPAGTPVLLVKDGGDTEDIPVMTGAAAVSDNDLVAGTATTATDGVATTDGDYTNMILNNIGGKVGFYFAAGQTVATNRAYLHIAKSLAPDAKDDSRMDFVFAGEETTGIKSVQGSGLTVNGFYDLQGRRVAQPQKGLYIMNGKKVVIK